MCGPLMHTIKEWQSDFELRTAYYFSKYSLEFMKTLLSQWERENAAK